MGCWTETCVLSKLPIRAYETCYMLVGNNILNMLFDTEDIKFITKKPYYLNIYLGTYDDYGRLEEFEPLDEDDDKDVFFVNVDVWKWLLSNYELLLSYHSHPYTKQHYQEEFDAISFFCNTASIYTDEYKNTLNHLEEYIKISYVCTRLRLCPNSLNVKGSQEIDYDIYKDWLEMLIRLVNSKIKEGKDNE
jgi:hypothetical protein